MSESALEGRDERMRRMVRRLDVDVLELAYARAGAVIGDARRACLQCPNTPECRGWLDGASADRPTFCPNLGRFERFIAH